MEIKHKNSLLILALVLILVTIGFLYFKTSDQSLIEVSKNLPPKLKVSDQDKSLPQKKIDTETQQIQSLKTVGSSIRKMVAEDFNINELMQELESLNLRPSKVVDRNQYTGDMTIVRTDKNLVGTRYFHGQFFLNDKGSHDLQHLSFDFNGGESSLEIVGNLLSESIGIERAPETSRAGYRRYRINSDYSLWAKVLTDEDFDDLKSHPYKAYERSDVGRVVRIAVEQEIH